LRWPAVAARLCGSIEKHHTGEIIGTPLGVSLTLWMTVLRPFLAALLLRVLRPRRLAGVVAIAARVIIA
jgi:hypothetical protein